VTWSVIDRWPTHPLLVKTFAQNIRQELDTFPENIKKKVGNNVKIMGGTCKKGEVKAKNFFRREYYGENGGGRKGGKKSLNE
jgi:hypothetical protein